MANISGEEAFARTLELFGLEQSEFAFARELVRGVRERLDVIDQVIAGVSRDWRLDRMANVDRNILRIALFELYFCPDIPASVALNEAIELAKMYGTEDSRRFVNGILGKVAEEPENYMPVK